MSGKPTEPEAPKAAETAPPVATEPTPAADRPVSLPEPERSAATGETAPLADPFVAPPAEDSAPAYPASEASTQRAAPRRGIALPVLGGALAAVLGFGVAQVMPEGWSLPAQSDRIAQIEARQADQARTFTTLYQAGDLTALDRRLTALEARLANLPADPGPELAALRADLAAVQQPAADPEALAALRAELEALRNELASRPDSAGLAADLSALRAEAEAERAATLARAEALRAEAETAAEAIRSQAAVLRLRAALDTGGPLAPALADLGAAGVELPAALTGHTDGVPTLAALQESFPDAARAALAASVDPAAHDSLADRAAAFLKAQTGMRSLTPREGTDVDAILSRAEAALAAGDLAQVSGELATLPPAAAEATATWQAAAAARIAAEAALVDLAARLTPQ